MSEIELLTKKELSVLKNKDDGMNDEDISSLYKMSDEEVKLFLAIALEKREKLRGGLSGSTVPLHIKPVDLKIGEEQTGTMKVGSQIIKYLSEGIYSSPASSLKELISNAYDADATEVNITINDDEVIIEDNGVGMNYKDFDEDFTFIGSSFKQYRVAVTKKMKRDRIGFLGIGFISVWELCDTMKIISAKENEAICFEAEINFSKYREDYAKDKEFYEISEYKLTNFEKREKGIPAEKGFTTIILQNLLPGFKNWVKDKHPTSYKFKTVKQIFDYLVDGGLGTTDLGRYWQLILDLSLIIPVKYSKSGPVKNIRNKQIKNLIKDINSQEFSIKVNNLDIIKPFNFPRLNIAHNTILIEDTITTEEGPVEFIGYFYVQHGIVKPKEFNGILTRIKNVSIGGIDRSLMNYSSSTNQLFRNWVFGEIYIKKGLEEAMNINRNQFKLTHPHYIEFKKYIHDFLNTKVFTLIKNDFYYAQKTIRKENKTKEHMNNINNITKKNLGKDYKVNLVKSRTSQPIVHNKKEKKIDINQSSKLITKFPTNERYLIEKILLLLEIAYSKSKGNSKKMKTLILEELEKLTGK